MVVVPCGFEATTTFYPGTRFGPRRFLEASTEIELFDLEVECCPWDEGILTEEEPPLFDQASPTLEALEKVVRRHLDEGRFPLVVGGEHTVALGPARAVVSRYPAAGFLQIDAHADFRDSYRGNPLNHACVGRRLAELGTVVMVGVRSVSREEWEGLRHDHRVTVIPSHVLRCEGWQHRVVDLLPPTVHLSVDLDGLDPSVIPGVGTPEPGGLSWQDFMTLLKLLFEHRRVVGADICELRPEPGTPRSEAAAARIAQRIFSLHVRQLKRLGA